MLSGLGARVLNLKFGCVVALSLATLAYAQTSAPPKSGGPNRGRDRGVDQSSFNASSGTGVESYFHITAPGSWQKLNPGGAADRLFFKNMRSRSNEMMAIHRVAFDGRSKVSRDDVLSHQAQIAAERARRLSSIGATDYTLNSFDLKGRSNAPTVLHLVSRYRALNGKTVLVVERDFLNLTPDSPDAPSLLQVIYSIESDGSVDWSRVENLFENFRLRKFAPTEKPKSTASAPKTELPRAWGIFLPFAEAPAKALDPELRSGTAAEPKATVTKTPTVGEAARKTPASSLCLDVPVDRRRDARDDQVKVPFEKQLASCGEALRDFGSDQLQIAINLYWKFNLPYQLYNWAQHMKKYWWDQDPAYRAMVDTQILAETEALKHPTQFARAMAAQLEQSLRELIHENVEQFDCLKPEHQTRILCRLTAEIASFATPSGLGAKGARAAFTAEEAARLAKLAQSATEAELKAGRAVTRSAVAGTTATESALDELREGAYLNRAQCPACPEKIRLSENNREHLKDHVLESRAPEIESLLNAVEANKTTPTELKARLPALQTLLSRARRQKTTSAWASEKGESLFKSLRLEPTSPREFKTLESGNHYFEIDHGGNRVAVIYCPKEPCHTPKLKAGDIDTIYPICGPDVIELPALERVEHTLNYLSNFDGANPDAVSGWNRKLRSGLPRLKPCH